MDIFYTWSNLKKKEKKLRGDFGENPWTPCFLIGWHFKTGLIWGGKLTIEVDLTFVVLTLSILMLNMWYCLLLKRNGMALSSYCLMLVTFLYWEQTKTFFLFPLWAQQWQTILKELWQYHNLQSNQRHQFLCNSNFFYLIFFGVQLRH